MNTLRQILIFNFFLLLHCKLNESFSVQPFNPSFGSDCIEIGIKEASFELGYLLN